MSVKRLPFDEAFTDISAQGKRIPQSQYVAIGEYPIVDQGKSFITGYTEDSSFLFEGNAPVIIFGDHTKCLKYVDFPFCVGADGVKVLTPKVEADTKYLYHYLCTVHIPEAGYSRHFKYLKRTIIPLPPLEEQKRIAAILDKADELRRKRREAIAKLDSLLQSVFLEMFGDPVSNPKGWTKQTIGSLTKVETGGTPSRTRPEYFEGNIPWVKTTEVTNGIIYETEESISIDALRDTNCRLFPVDTILMAMYGQGLTRGRTAKLGIEATTNQACAAILPSPNIHTDYLWHFLRLSYSHIRDLGRGGNQPNMNLSLVRGIEVPVPHIELQQDFATIFQKQSAIREVFQRGQVESEQFFTSLQKQVFERKS